ncbi:glutathione S-transferase [Henriciella barbarensis]|uniref:Glutathione S-transferase n=1 Tax=Henriciella barbarensis TaxID=86342 RepID=A0A399QRA2_9PROT|nr:glutathione S-transferase [Henriciella barbarensis]RIJ21370.1 glutathione S-transferase [Henriciella barbarensis]
MTLPVLYSFRRCPYAMRARLAIQSAGLQCRLREVVLRDKPQQMLDASPKGTVPVLVLEDSSVVDESLDVMLYALGQNDPESWLAPEEGSRNEMLDLIAACDGPFKHHLDRYKYANRYEDEGAVSEDHRKAGSAFLETLNSRLSSRAQLFGERVSLADMAVMPFIRQFANTDRVWFDAAPYPALKAWLAAHLKSERFKSIMPKFDQWKTGDEEPVFPSAT